MARAPRKKKEYYPRVNPLVRFTDAKFIQRYRLDKATTLELADKFGRSPYCTTKGMKSGGGGSIAEKFCLALRYFATGAIYSAIGDFQGVTKGTVTRAVQEVSDFLYYSQGDYIKWPVTFVEQMEKAATFYEKKKKPGVIGMVDGSHVPIIAPKKNEGAYVNRKQYHSLNIMVVCDADKVITHVDARFAGSVNDAYVIRASELSTEGEGGLMNNFFLLGDSGYPLREWLLTPYMTPRSQAERAYNIWHRRTRCGVEHALGIMKQRFRAVDCSSGYMFHTPKRAARIVVACAALHNVARSKKLPVPPEDRDPDRRRARPNPIEQPRRQRVRQPKAGPAYAARDRYVADNFAHVRATPHARPRRERQQGNKRVRRRLRLDRRRQR